MIRVYSVCFHHQKKYLVHLNMCYHYKKQGQIYCQKRLLPLPLRILPVNVKENLAKFNLFQIVICGHERENLFVPQDCGLLEKLTCEYSLLKLKTSYPRNKCGKQT